MMDRSFLVHPYTLMLFLCGFCRQEQRQTYQHLWHKTPPNHPLSAYVFLSPTIFSLPSFMPSCQYCAKEPSPFSLTHLSCPFMMISPLSLSSSSLLDFLHPHHLWVLLSSPPPLSLFLLFLHSLHHPPRRRARARTCTLVRESALQDWSLLAATGLKVYFESCPIFFTRTLSNNMEAATHCSQATLV